MTAPIILALNIEHFKGTLHGTTLVGDNLIVEYASSEQELEEKLHQVIEDFHDLKPSEYNFQKRFDLSYFFVKFDFLKINKVAALSGINPSLLRQYVIGGKVPSDKQVLKVKVAIEKIIESLSESEIIFN